MIIISINPNEDINELNINENNDIINELKKINNMDISLLYYWNYDDNYIIKCYGNYENDLFDVNNHILPINGISDILNELSNEIKLYGNIYMILYKNNIMVDYNISNYGCFYYMEDTNIINFSNMDYRQLNITKYTQLQELKLCLNCNKDNIFIISFKYN